MNHIEQLIDTTCELQRLISLRIRHALEQRGGTVLQTQVLLFLHEKPGATASELAALLGVSLSAITQLADRLIGGGLLRREDDMSDRRTTHLYVTAKGGHDFNQFLEARREGMRNIFGRLSKDDIAELTRLHQLLLSLLKEEHTT